MFTRRTNASKVAMAWLVARLRVGGFKLLDTQFLTPHLASMGTIEVPRNAYQSLLSEAVATPADFGALDSLEAPAGAARGGDAAGSGALSGKRRSEEHTSELQSLMRISYAVFCLKKKNTQKQ